eukprot:499323_1
MGSLFEEYCNEIDVLLQTTEKLADTDKDKAEDNVDEIEDLIRQVELEARMLPSAQRTSANENILKYKNGVKRIKNTILTSRSGPGPAVKESKTDDFGSEQQSSHQRSMAVLKQSQRQLAETEELAVDTATSVRLQSEQIDKMAGQVDTINDDLSYSNKVLTRMNKWWRRI